MIIFVIECHRYIVRYSCICPYRLVIVPNTLVGHHVPRNGKECHQKSRLPGSLFAADWAMLKHLRFGKFPGTQGSAPAVSQKKICKIT